ncbi:DUF481 domain-containing protein [Sulfuricurvum sp.]|uniref:DUF481 domain-containing protein n=1 Tax=Sulfuricurvum sp. TaxID=2025608 RepID=UPI003C321093
MIQKGFLPSLFLGVTLMGHESPLITQSKILYIDTKRSTDIPLIAFEGVAKKQWDEHALGINVNLCKSTDSEKMSKDKWSSELSYNYKIGSRTCINYLVGYKEDRFIGLDYQLYSKPEIGVKAIDSAEHQLDFKANLLYGENKSENGPSDSYSSSRVGAIYRWQVKDNLKFTQESFYRVNLENTQYNYFNSKIAMETKITPILSMGISYKVDYMNIPLSPSTIDRTFLVSLIAKRF